MAEKNNAKCSICGKDYYMCLSCKDTISIHPWKRLTDTSEHYKVFQIVKGYNTGVYTKDEVRTKLKNVDLSDLDTYKPNIKSIIEDVLKEEPAVEVVEDTVIDETEVAAVEKEEIPVVEKTTVSRKKSNKVEAE